MEQSEWDTCALGSTMTDLYMLWDYIYIFVCVNLEQSLPCQDRNPLDTDTDPRYFYGMNVDRNMSYIYFESSVHKGHYLAYVDDELKLRKSAAPENDVSIHFMKRPVGVIVSPSDRH